MDYVCSPKRIIYLRAFLGMRNQRLLRPTIVQSPSIDYQVRISDELEDLDWDAFVVRTPGGHHVQTSLWAQVKAVLGWRVARIVVTHREHIVAGAQLLIRPMPPIGAVGYVTKGPLCTSDDLTLAKFVIDKLHRISRAHHVQCLVIQPSNNGEAIACQLPRWGFRRSPVAVAPTASILIDLAPDLDDILAQVKRQTRQNIRRAKREGVTVREGTKHDLHAFHRLYTATSQRQNFVTYHEEYHAEMWRVLEPPGYLKLFLAECEGEAISAQLMVPFGDTVIAKALGWSGLHGNRRPNEALYWASIQWAKSRGYRYFDWEGIDPVGARAILDGRPLPEPLHLTPTFFKLGFGGQVVLYPEPYDYVYNPLLRWAYGKISTQIGNWSSVGKILNRLKTCQAKDT